MSWESRPFLTSLGTITGITEDSLTVFAKDHSVTSGRRYQEIFAVLSDNAASQKLRLQQTDVGGGQVMEACRKETDGRRDRAMSQN